MAEHSTWILSLIWQGISFRTGQEEAQPVAVLFVILILSKLHSQSLRDVKP